MPKFVFLVNNDGYRKCTWLAAQAAGASVPRIGAGLVQKFFDLHNAEPLNRYIELPFKNIWRRMVVDESLLTPSDDIYFCMYESFRMTYSRNLISHYKKRFPKAKFFFFFSNPVSQYNFRRVEKIRGLLDGVFSFNMEDVKKYHLLYMPEDPFLLPQQAEVAVTSDLFFIGSDKGRLPILLEIFERVQALGGTCDFWITEVPQDKQKHADIIHYNQRLSYEEVLRHDASTRCILEVLQERKSYTSLRTYEALQYHKKILTMSKTVRQQWFYDPQIISVLKNPDDISLEFIRKDIPDGRFDNIKLGSFERFEEQFMKQIFMK